jgi:hypothetical protein
MDWALVVLLLVAPIAFVLVLCVGAVFVLLGAALIVAADGR